MKQTSVILLAFCAAAFCIPRYAEAQVPVTEIFRQEGIASWYGPEFDGRPTASGEIFNSSFLTAAHPSLPFGTMLTVTNLHNNKKVTVKVNDRGPFVSARIIDVSRAAAEQLDMIKTGTAPVLIESLERIVLSSPEKTTVADQYWTLPSGQGAQAANPSPPVSGIVPLQPEAYPSAPAYTPPPAPPIEQAPPAQSSIVYVPVDPARLGPVVAPIPPAASTAPAAAAPPPAPVYGSAVLTPSITPSPGKTYRLQVGSYKIAKNAVESFEKLKNSGLNPAYERNGEYFRVVLAGIRGTEIQAVAEKLGSAGFREAFIREER
ncbi:MAG: septal ring lytic transglycosylase RlpA family protein [Treponema sp.]|nr:septal ring lytic transglycosylase RlpA family protein [Treponema sp.]